MMSIEDLEQFRSELAAELSNQSDRGLAILGAAGLDSYLEDLLSTRLIKESDKDAIFQGTGPLSTFSARITLAFGLGLISKDEYRELNLIRKIRNEFAHAHTGVSFESPTIKGRSLSLTIGERLYAPETIPFTDLGGGKLGIPDDLSLVVTLPADALQFPNSANPRERFKESVDKLLWVLAARIALADVAPESPAILKLPQDLTALIRDGYAKNVERIETLIREQLSNLAELEKLQGSRFDHEKHGDPSLTPEEVATNKMQERIANYRIAVLDKSQQAATVAEPVRG